MQFFRWRLEKIHIANVHLCMLATGVSTTDARNIAKTAVVVLSTSCGTRILAQLRVV